jgi:phenylpropionate dioxygenase-like ring-hydroxylating dioxygenase large terminal subunit
VAKRLKDCCCHRAAPLSLGEISGDYLACGHHALKFDVNGKCVEIPARTQVVWRQGAQLSGCGKMERRLDLDG